MRAFEGYSHGINLGGWLSQCDHTKERYENFIREEDIRTIAEWGLDHVRVPIDYDLVEEKDGTYKEEGFGYIQRALDWCGRYGINMVLDLHKTFGFSFDDGEHELGFFENEAYQERFYRLWEEFAKRYGKYEDRLAFELLNEVTAKEYCETWNRIAKTCVERIRAIAPTIRILIGGYYNNSISALKDLEAPFDENIVYNFHCYEPLAFTHQGAPWVSTMDVNYRIPFDSTYAEYLAGTEEQWHMRPELLAEAPQDQKLGSEYFEKYMQEAVRVAEERNVPLYCGEYGVINRATPEDVLAWYQCIEPVFRKHKISRAAWSYREMDYGIVDAHLDPVREKLLKLL